MRNCFLILGAALGLSSIFMVGCGIDAAPVGAGDAGVASADGGGTDAGVPPGPPAPATYSVGGTVAGLLGKGMVLQNNGGDDVAVSADGKFAFPTKLSAGKTFEVKVKTQPTAPSQVCSVSGGTGSVVKGDVTSVVVNCATNTFTVGGAVSGLDGKGLVLQNNGGADLPINADGSFAFTPQADGTAYAVTIKTQPTNKTQTCTVTGGTGTVAGANVTTVAIACVTSTFTVGGTISGLTASGLVLQNNAGDDVSPANGDTSFTFPTSIASGSPYAVTVKAQPDTLFCSVASGSGTVTDANVTDVAVTCAPVPSDCQAIKAANPAAPDGVYRIRPASTTFQAYCDMTTDGGGWTMCYTQSAGAPVHIETETAFTGTYGTSGYRSDCRDVSFTDVLYVNHTGGTSSWFKRAGGAMTLQGGLGFNSAGDAGGRFVGYGSASPQWSYQLNSCDEAWMYVGLMMSGYTNCSKLCGNWCGDTVSDYYRTDGDFGPDTGQYHGVAFAENGHTNVSDKTMSVGLRNLPIDAALPVTAGLVSHYDARETGSVIRSGANVTGWVDLSGNGRHLSTVSGTPQFSTTLINGKPAIDFAGAGMRVDNVPLTTDVTFFAVMTQRSSGQWGPIAHHGSRDNDWSMEQSGLDWPSSNVLHWQSVNDNTGAELTLTADSSYVLTGRIDGTARYFSATDGAGTTSVTATGNSITAGNKSFYVGRSDIGELSNAYIGELVYFDHALTDAERDKMVAYLKTAWGL